MAGLLSPVYLISINLEDNHQKYQNHINRSTKMNLFKSLAEIGLSFLKGENNYTIISNNITFLVKYLQENHQNKFKTKQDIFITACFINLRYYLIKGIITIEDLKKWTHYTIKSEDSLFNELELTNLIALVQKFIFKEQFKNSPKLLGKVEDQVEDNWDVIHKECLKTFKNPLIIEKKLHKQYLSDIDLLINSNLEVSLKLREMLNIVK